MKNLTAFFLLFLIMPACHKESFNIVNLNNNKISVIGHGGMGMGERYPMNSIESIIDCLSLGAEGVEIDVQMTKDSVLVAFHDESLETATNISGRIFDKNWDEIKNAIYNNSLYTGYNLVTLDELFENVPGLKTHTFFLDCKNANTDTSISYINRFNTVLSKIIDKHGIADNVYIEFTRMDIIRTFGYKRPDLKIFLYSDFDLNTVNDLHLHGLITDVDDITKEQVLEAHNNGKMVAVYNANSKEKNMEAIEKNVDFIETDNVKHLIKLLR